MVKRIIVVTVVVVIAAVIAAMVYADATAATAVQTANAARETIRTYIEERARTTLPRTWRLTMPLAGRIQPITIQEGAAVKQGQVVAELDPADLDTAVAEAQARVGAAEARIQKQKTHALEDLTLHEYDRVIESMAAVVQASEERVKAGQARLKYTDWWLQATEKAFLTKATDENTLKRARTERAEAHVDLATERLITRAIVAFKAAMQIYPKYLKEYLALKDMQLTVMDRELAESQSALERAKRDRSRARLVSPVDGVVLRRHVSNERVLGAGAPLLDIGRLQDLEVTVEVLTREVTAARSGNAVEIYGPVIGSKPVRGQVKRIDPAAFTKVSSLGVEQQRVNVIVTLEPDDVRRLEQTGAPFGVDYRVRVRIFTAEKTNAVTVPRSALFRGSNEVWQVFRVENGRARRVTVEVGLLNDYRAEVVKGLQAGDTVIVAPESALADGAQVHPALS